ncbi:metallophosphoesterase, partial [Pyxidicoccus sp. 3LFB2]
MLIAGLASAASLTRGPYLQSVTPTSALIAFRLDATCPAQVRYGVGGDLSLTAASSATARQHAVELSGLQPGAEYSYTVEGCGVPLGPPHRFRTATGPETREVRFAVLGDFGTGSSDQADVARSIQSRRPEFIITVGDNIYESGTDAEFESNFLAPMGSLFAEVPLFPSLGNHEYVTNQGQPYLDNFYLPANNPRGTERYYSFDWGNVHFVALDSNCLRGSATADRCRAEEQLAWLQQDLAASRAHWKVVYLHHPLWSSGKYGSYVPLRQQLAPILEAGGVDLVFAGHEHDYERTRPMRGDAEAASGTARGITYAVVGSGGASLRPFTTAKPAWSVVRDAENNGFLEVSVQADTLSAQMVTPSGKVLDSFSLTKPLPPDSSLVLTAAAEPARGQAPLEVLFGATVSPPGAELSWTLTDGRVASGAQVRERFDEPGSYSVQVEARRGTEVVTRQVTVVVEAPGQVDPGEDGGAPGEGGPVGPPPSDAPGPVGERPGLP